MTASAIGLARQIIPEEAWYAVLTRYRCEKTVTARLEKEGILSFLPLIEQVHRWSDRQKRIQLPLFAGYIFVGLGLSQASRLGVLRTPGVLRFVSFGREILPVPAKQIEDLKILLSNNIPCSLHAFLTAGQRVRIRGGSLDGIEGILKHSDQKTLVISIECIQRSIAVHLEGYDVELV